MAIINSYRGPSINYVVQNLDFLMVCQSKSQKSYFWYWSLKTTSYFGKQSVPPCQNLQSINTNSIENKLTFLNFYWDTKNSSITTEKSVFISSNGDWKCLLNSTIICEIPIFWERRIFTNGLCRKYRVLTTGLSVSFGDVVYGRPLEILAEYWKNEVFSKIIIWIFELKLVRLR